ncbi:OmpA family protein [Rubellimicrobium rubrum]|uniref:OmpA family protein n=1 Tax=Rubellimicrobium rubrum TaxID=2585369 RepID=A0A5C4MZB2_9RHOB|nr:OmpA family protein [Rubellimicrobium rubrum]TNC49841.1 OmpA family protein [Rubellimicrobium rubrum]
MRPSLRLVATLVLLAPQALALTLDLPAAATLALEDSQPLASHGLATGPWADGFVPERIIEGAVTRQVWQTGSSGRTTLQIIDPLRVQLAAQGFQTLLDCEGDDCGGFDFRRAIKVLPPPAMFVDLVDFRYVSAVSENEGLSLLVSRSEERGFIQIIRVVLDGNGAEPPKSDVTAGAPTAPPTKGDLAEGLGARLEAEGRVALDGLRFATGSAELAAGGDAELAALGAYLSGDPGRRVALVGHTDAQGSLDSNVALSRQRAQAVVDRLVTTFGVAPAQIQAEGMGWLAPRATNLTPDGREANRRVEAVVLPR